MQQTLPKTLRILLALFFALVPLDYVLPHIGTSTMLTPVGAALAVFCVGDIFLHRKGKITLPREELCVILIAVLSLVSVAWAKDHAAAFSYFISLTLTIAMYVLLASYDYSTDDLRFVEIASILGGVALAIYVFTQVGMEQILEGARLDFKKIGGEAFSDPNGLAGRLMFSFVFSLKRVLQPGTVLKKALSLAATVLVVYLVFLTGSRGGLLAMVVAVLPIIFVSPKGRGRFLLSMIPVVILLMIYLPKILPSHLYARIFDFDTYQNRVTADGDRIDIWGHLLADLFPMSPIWGYGSGNTFMAFTSVYGQVKSVHNAYLLVLGDLGLLGFIPWMYYIFQKIKRAFAVRNADIFCLSAVLAVLFVCFFLDATKEKYLWNAFLFAYMNYSAHILNKPTAADEASTLD